MSNLFSDENFIQDSDKERPSQINWRKGILLAAVAITIFVGADLINQMVDRQAENQAEILARSISGEKELNPSLPGLMPNMTNERDQGISPNATRNLSVFMRRPGDEVPPELPENAQKQEQKQPNAEADSSASPSEGDPTPQDAAGPAYANPYSDQTAVNGTDQDISVQGVMLNNDAGLAVVSVSGQSYTVSQGEKAGPYKVEEISEDGVTVSHNGQQSTIRVGEEHNSGSAPASGQGSIGNYPPVLPDPDKMPPPPAPVALNTSAGSTGYASEPTSPTSQRSPSRQINQRHQTSAPVAPKEVKISEPSRGQGAAGNQLARADLQAMAAGGATLLRDVSAEENHEGNGQGVKIKFRTQENALTKMGLKDGDVILSINGRPIRSSEEFYNTCLHLQNAKSIFVHLNRGDDDTSISCPIQD